MKISGNNKIKSIIHPNVLKNFLETMRWDDLKRSMQDKFEDDLISFRTLAGAYRMSINGRRSYYFQLIHMKFSNNLECIINFNPIRANEFDESINIKLMHDISGITEAQYFFNEISWDEYTQKYFSKESIFGEFLEELK